MRAVPTTIHTTKKWFEGPWLLDRRALTDLDSIFERWVTKWKAAVDEETQQAVERRLREMETERRSNDPASDRADLERSAREYVNRMKNREPAKQLTLAFGNEKKVVAKSLEELETDPDVVSQIATSFNVRIDSDGSRTTFRAAAITVERGSLEIAVESQREDARGLFVALHQWANSNRAPIIQRFWRAAAPYVGSLLFVAALLMVMFALDSSSPDETKEKARALAVQGVTENTRDEALRLLLALLAGGDSSKSNAVHWRRFGIAGLMLLIAVVIVNPPGIVIGIGAGDQRLRSWRTWMRFLFWGIPGAVLLPFALNLLANRVSSP